VVALPPQATEWERRRTMPTARGGCAYGVAVGQLLCAGGESGRTALGTVEGYDPIGDVWYDYPDMPVDRAGTQGTVIGERLYVPGGAQVLAFEPTDTLYVFSALDTAPQP
jgi:Kelch motif protein